MIKKVIIKEAYCSYEVSKLLKEKGFDENTSMVYMSYGDLCKCNRYDSIHNSNYNDITKNYFECTAPTHQMAMAWLREEKNIFISICNGNHCKLDKNISSETVYYFFSITNSYGVYKEEEQCFDEFKTYEEATESAIKYCLENLI